MVYDLNLHCNLLKIKSRGNVHNTWYTGLIRVPSGVKQIFFYFGGYSPQWTMASSFTRFLDDTQRRTTISRTPLDE